MTKKLVLLYLLTACCSTANAQMTFDEFMTSFKDEISEKLTRASAYVSESYQSNKEQDPEYAVVDTTQDVIIDAGKAYWGLSKEAYREARIMYYEHQLKSLKDEKQSEQ